MNLAEVVALLAGGASGLGAATARAFAAAGARVVLADVNGAAAEAIARDIGNAARATTCDVTREDSVQQAVDFTLNAFGALHVLVNCAGIAPPERVLGKNGPHRLDVFQRVIDVNLIGTFNVLRLAAQAMDRNAPNAEGERGVVINTASVAAFDGQIGQAAYSASKAGVAGMTLPIARECADYGIRVMTIAPGLFDTPMMAGLPESVRVQLAQAIPFPKRLGRPTEYAALARHIIENPMLNGECIRLDGSLRMTAR